MAKTDWGNQ